VEIRDCPACGAPTRAVGVCARCPPSDPPAAVSDAVLAVLRRLAGDALDGADWFALRRAVLRRLSAEARAAKPIGTGRGAVRG
jgi:hypothetical protein